MHRVASPKALSSRTSAQIQTRPGLRAATGEDYTPVVALRDAVNDLQAELRTLDDALRAEVTRVQMMRVMT